MRYSGLRSQGFTLIEVLLVVALIAIAAISVVATLPIGQTQNPNDQAEKIKQTLLLLSDQAMLSGQEYGLLIEEKKRQYHLMQLNEEGWQPLKSQDWVSSVTLADNITLSIRLGNDIWLDDDRLFEPSSLFDEDMFADQEKKKWPTPQLFVTSSGDLTPATILLSQEASGEALTQEWRVVTHENGEVTLTRPGEQEGV